MAAAVGDADAEGYLADEQQSLEEFIATHTLPQCVAVTRGSHLSPTALIERGDVLLLRQYFPSQITLTFFDDGARREVTVSPDIPVKFLVLPPKDSASSDPLECQSGAGGNGYRPLSMVTYPAVADLLLDCPTYFEANTAYEDPYLPGFSIKPGDKFRFVKVMKESKRGAVSERLQCRTESGELVCLSLQCKGNFTVLKDDRKYTLRELIDLAVVPRRLRLAPGNEDLDSELDLAAIRKSVSAEGDGIPDLPMTFTGVINMSKPESKLEVSPFDNLDTQWIVSAKANLYVKVHSASDYEEPVKQQRVRPQHIATFVTEHEQNFPAQATLVSYTTPPDIIAQCLSDCRNVIVHEAVKTPKLFVKDAEKDVYFCLSESLDISFVEIPKTLNSIFQMMALPLGSEVRVLADVAADFPQPFVLRYGDILRVTKHDSASWKLKHSSTGEVPIVKCERIVQGGKEEKLKLPLDLEVRLIVHSDPSKLKMVKLADIISGTEPVPSGKMSVLEGNGSSYGPLPASLKVLQVLKDTELVLSPLDTTMAISPVVKMCAHVPVRHKVILAFKRKLEFPDGYFVMPQLHQRLSIEQVTEEEYEELEREKKLATEYEDYSFSSGRNEGRASGGSRRGENEERLRRGRGRNRALNESTTSEESLPTSEQNGSRKRSKSKDRLRRLSRGLNPKNWRIKRDKPEPETEPQVPVSGLLTLSLQPHQAKSNEYLDQVPKSPPKHSHPTPQVQASASQEEEEEECPYEDVVISHMPVTKSTSLQSSTSDHMLSARVRPSDFSSSTGELNRMSDEGSGRRPSKPEKEEKKFATIGPSYLRKAKNMVGEARSLFGRQIEDIGPKFKKKFRPGRSSHSSDNRSESSEEPPSPQQLKALKELSRKGGSEKAEKYSDSLSVDSQTSSNGSDSSPQNRSFEKPSDVQGNTAKSDTQSCSSPGTSTQLSGGRKAPSTQLGGGRSKTECVETDPARSSPIPKPSPRRRAQLEKNQEPSETKDVSETLKKDSFERETLEKSSPSSVTVDSSEKTENQTSGSPSRERPPIPQRPRRKIDSAPDLEKMQEKFDPEKQKAEPKSQQGSSDRSSSNSETDNFDPDSIRSRGKGESPRVRLRSPVTDKPPPPPKPAVLAFKPKERAPMDVLMGPPPTAPPRKRSPRIGSMEATDLFPKDSGAKPKIMGRKPGTE